jgi:RNA polymerase sigma-70 factor (ECF subfamily)
MSKEDLSGICKESIFSGFFNSHAKALRNYLYYKFGNEDQAEDVTQEAFIKLWQNCADVPVEKAKSYIYTIANNASLNVIAHQKVVLNYAKSSPNKDRTNESPDFILEEAVGLTGLFKLSKEIRYNLKRVIRDFKDPIAQSLLEGSEIGPCILKSLKFSVSAKIITG